MTETIYTKEIEILFKKYICDCSKNLVALYTVKKVTIKTFAKMQSKCKESKNCANIPIMMLPTMTFDSSSQN